MAEPAGPAKARPNIYDVAERAGVSHMTVSRVLNDGPNIKASTRERVLRAIEEMNYTRSSIARALATRRAMRIGVLVDSSVQFGPNSTLRAIEAAAREGGYAVSAFSVSDEEGSRLSTGVDELTGQGVDALCVIAPRESSLDLLRRRGLSVPTIVIRAESDPQWHTLAVDQRHGAFLAVQHLLDLGHRRILHLAGPSDWYDARERERGWRDALSNAGVEAPDPVVGDWTADAGYAMARDADLDQVTAIFAANDRMALGVLHALSDRGVSVPGDVSVIGFDDVPDARHFLPPLTTVRQDFEALGAAAVRVVMDAIAGRVEDGDDRIEPELVIRSSTAPPS